MDFLKLFWGNFPYADTFKELYDFGQSLKGLLFGRPSQRNLLWEYCQ